jgi:hypothetical protein
MRSGWPAKAGTPYWGRCPNGPSDFRHAFYGLHCSPSIPIESRYPNHLGLGTVPLAYPKNAMLFRLTCGYDGGTCKEHPV